MSYAKLRKNKEEYKKEMSAWKEKNKNEQDFPEYVLALVREIIIQRNISVFGLPDIYFNAGDSVSADEEFFKSSYGGRVSILNAGKMKAPAIEKLKVAQLSFQTLVAPTLVRANLYVSVVYNDKRGKGPRVSRYHYRDKTVTIVDRRPTDDSIKRIVYHEMMHAVDHALPEVMEQAFAILKSRCGENPEEDLTFYTELFSSRRDFAFVIRDSFINSYAGRVYGGRSTEISTMAIDQFAYPETMLSLMRTDFQLFSHALAICYGTYFDFNPERP